MNRTGRGQDGGGPRRYDAGSRLWLWVRIAVAVGLLAIVAWRVDWDRFWEVVLSVNLLWLLAASASAALDRLWMAAKWLYLLRRLDIVTTLRDTVHHYLTGGLVGLAAQWQLGGDIARAIGLGRKTGDSDTVVVSLVAEKLTGAAASSIIALVGLSLLHAFVPSEMMPLYVTGLAVCATTLGTLLVLTSRASGRVVGWLHGRLSGGPSGRVRHRLRRAVVALRRVTELERSTLAKFFLMTFGEQFVPWINVALLAAAFGLELTVLEVAMTIPIITFYGRLPISVESLGVREGLYVMLFSLAGWSAAEALAVALTARAVDLLVVGIGSLVFMGMDPWKGHSARFKTPAA